MQGLIPTPEEMNILMITAKTAVKSNLLKGKSEDQAIAIALYANELGLPIMQSLLGGINIINGVAEISSRMMNNLIRKKGHKINCIECNKELCILEGIRADNQETCRVTFTFQDAEAAGVVRKDGPWTKWTEDMLYARAFSRLARRLFADAIGPGAYVEGEISGNDISLSTEEITVQEEKLTKEQANHIKQLLKNNTDLLMEILEKSGKRMVADFNQSQYPKMVEFIEKKLKEGVA